MQTEKLNILYDHYKETFDLIKSQNKLRDKLFIYLLITLVFMFLQINEVDKVHDISIKLTEKFLGVSISLSAEFISIMFWFIMLSLVVKYAQTLIYIERQYSYIHKLEQNIDENFNKNKIFSREGHSYLNNYPKFSLWIWAIYTIIFPFILFLVLEYKLYNEFTGDFSTPFIIDSILCIMIFITMYLYLRLIHKKNISSKDSKVYTVTVTKIK